MEKTLAPADRRAARVRSAGVTALALFAVTAALALLLAQVSPGVAAVPVFIAGTLPGLLLARLAVPGVISPQNPSRPAGELLRPGGEPAVTGLPLNRQVLS